MLSVALEFMSCNVRSKELSFIVICFHKLCFLSGLFIGPYIEWTSDS